MTPSFGRLGRVLGFGLAALVFATPVAFGGVHGWASALLEIGIWALAFAWFVARRVVPGARSDGPTDRAVVGTALALGAYLIFQLVPLPRNMLAVLSPTALEFYRHTIDRIVSIEPAVGPIRSVGEFEDGQVPVAARQGIADKVTALPPLQAGSARPVALYPFAAASDLLRYLAYGLAFWLAATLPRPGTLLRAIVFAGMLVAGLGIVQNVTWNGLILWVFSPYEEGPSYYPRMTGPFVNPDHFAAFLEMGLPCGAALIALAIRRARAEDKSYPHGIGRLTFGLAVTVAGLIGSASRAALLGSIFGLCVLWLGLRRHDRQHRRRRRHQSSRQGTKPGLAIERTLRRWLPVFVTGAILVGGILYAGPLAHRTLESRILHMVIAPDFDFRARMWMQSLPIVKDFPITGVGAGAWREVMPRYQRYPVLGVQHTHTHNDYIEWACEVGGLGVLLTALLAWTVVRWARANDGVPGPVRWGLIAGILAIGWHELVDFGLRMPANALVLSILCGLLCNRRWREALVTEAGAPTVTPRTLAAIAVAVLVTAGLTLASIDHFREFLQWRRARTGQIALRFSPADADTWEYVGGRLFGAGLRYEPPTEAVFRVAARLRPVGGSAYWALSLVTPSYESKVAALEAALYADPDRTPWRLAYAANLEALGWADDALAQIEEAVFRDHRLGSHLYLLDPEHPPNEPLMAAAERGFQRALAAHPNSLSLIVDAATVFDLRERRHEAADLWIRAAERGGWERYGIRAADSYALAGNYTKAEHAAKQAIEAAPSLPDGYRTLALSVYMRQQRYEDALEALRRGIQRTRDPAPVYRTLFDIESTLGHMSAALDALAHAAELRPRDADIQFRLGAAYLTAGEHLNARRAIDRAIEIDPSRASYHHIRGRALERLYELGAARDAYRQAVILDPGDAAAARDLARIEGMFGESAQSR